MDFSAMKSPWVKYSVFGVVGVGILWIIYQNIGGGGGSTSVVQVRGTDPAIAGLQGQQNQLNASIANQNSERSYTLALERQRAQSMDRMKKLDITNTGNQILGAIQLADIAETASTARQAMQLAAQIHMADGGVAVRGAEIGAQQQMVQIQANTGMAALANNRYIAENENNLIGRMAQMTSANQPAMQAGMLAAQLELARIAAASKLDTTREMKDFGLNVQASLERINLADEYTKRVGAQVKTDYNEYIKTIASVFMMFM